ncbi:hypothetical protein [Nocardioides sp.]|uniref:hypothetical protein n=1 Tax=Nocardioides sp. TaxID=35761 RepID=UPI003D0D94FB
MTVHRWRNLVATGLGCMLAVAIGAAAEPMVAATVSSVFVTVLVLAGLVPAVAVGRRAMAAVTRRHFRPVGTARRWVIEPAPEAPTPAELRRTA